jgi:type II secretory pathway pseudopilin PulG
MTNDERMTKTTVQQSSRSSFVIRHSSFRTKGAFAFTIIELLVTIALIIILAGLILSTIGYVQTKGARSRAETEIAAISAALENYKADNGIYPRDPVSNTATDKLDARTMGNSDPNASTEPYAPASLVLYRALSGDRNLDRKVDTTDESLDIGGNKLNTPLTALPNIYFTFKPNQLGPSDQTVAVQNVRDPFGYIYGYSTAYQNSSSTGYNPTYDLWSTARLTSDPPVNKANDTTTPQWIKNW